MPRSYRPPAISDAEWQAFIDSFDEWVQDFADRHNLSRQIVLRRVSAFTRPYDLAQARYNRQQYHDALEAEEDAAAVAVAAADGADGGRPEPAEDEAASQG